MTNRMKTDIIKTNKLYNKIKGGKSDKLTIEDLAKKHGVSVDVIKKELEAGIKIEMEHTKDKNIAIEIAMDHIEEFVDYYTNKEAGLKASEDKLKKSTSESFINIFNEIINENISKITSKKS